MRAFVAFMALGVAMALASGPEVRPFLSILHNTLSYWCIFTVSYCQKAFDSTYLEASVKGIKEK